MLHGCHRGRDEAEVATRVGQEAGPGPGGTHEGREVLQMAISLRRSAQGVEPHTQDTEEGSGVTAILVIAER